MVKFLVLSHGGLARELLLAAETILGRSARISALTLDWDDEPEVVRDKIGRSLEALEPADGVVILADAYGSTPHNVAKTFCEPGRVEIVAGVNLPMVVRLGCLEERERGAAELARWIEMKGRGSICRAEGGGGER